MLTDDEPGSSRLLAAFDEDAFNYRLAATTEDTPFVLDPARILMDRPDVLAAFYSEYFGPLNDRSSDAWMKRVGGETPEDYARYWYEAHGRQEGYAQSLPSLSAPAEDGPAAYAGRTTYDGVPIAKILADRPDVFQAFFTEYYGSGNDRNSNAWVERVGGTTVEDYADYWYRAHGKASGYVPSSPAPSAPDPAPPAPDDEPAPSDLPPDDEIVDGVDETPDGDGVTGPDPNEPDLFVLPDDIARPLIATYTDEGLVLTPATDAEMRSLFAADLF